MAYSLMTKFNELTSGAFGYLVLESVDVDIGADSVRVNLIYPELKEKEVRKQYDQITEAVVKAMGSKAMVSVKLTKSHFDCDFFKAKLITFFENCLHILYFPLICLRSANKSDVSFFVCRKFAKVAL